MFAITFTSIQNGRRHTGTYELDLDQMTKAAIANDILDGQFEGIDEVFEFNPEEGWARNVTKDMAETVAALAAQNFRTLSHTLKDWLQEKGGLSLYHESEAA